MTAMDVIPLSSEEKRTTLTVCALAFNYNGGDRIIKTIERLTEQVYPLTQIILVDNHSTDGSPERVAERFPTVTVHDTGENNGISWARNRGMELVDTDLIFLVDNDVYVEDDTIGRLVETYEAFDCPTVVCPQIRLIPETTTVQAEGAECHFLGTNLLRHGFSRIGQFSTEPCEVGGAISAAYLVNREEVVSAGGYEELFFFYFEDHEISLRLRSLGYRFVCDPQAVVYHDRGEGTPGLSFRGHEKKYPARRLYMSMRNRLITILMHYHWRTLLVLLPVLLVYEVMSFGMALSRRGPWQWFRAWGWILGHPGIILKKRRAIQQRRVVPDKHLLAGGPIPLAPNIGDRGLLKIVADVSGAMFNGYWKIARPMIG